MFIAVPLFFIKKYVIKPVLVVVEMFITVMLSVRTCYFLHTLMFNKVVWVRLNVIYITF